MANKPTMFRTPSGRTAHLLNAFAPATHTACGSLAMLGYRWNPADLPSGERTVYKMCEGCRAARKRNEG